MLFLVALSFRWLKFSPFLRIFFCRFRSVYENNSIGQLFRNGEVRLHNVQLPMIESNTSWSYFFIVQKFPQNTGIS